MGRKCCVTNCNGNYDSNSKEKVFRLPSDKSERARWLSVIPRDNTPDTKYTVVCERHWPIGYETITYYGKQRPSNPPSVFSCVKPSLRTTPLPPPRPTKRSFAEVRFQVPDEMELFDQMDKICDFESLTAHILQYAFGWKVHIIATDKEVLLQSQDMLEGTGIFKYMLKINHDLSYDAYRSGIKCSIIPLSRNRVTQLARWSQIEEAVRFLHTLSPTWKDEVMREQAESMGVKQVGEKRYSTATIVRAFSYFALSRTTYERLRIDMQLPSIATLTRMTSAAKRFDDIAFYTRIFSSLSDEQKTCIVLLDEVYVKSMLQYHGGKIFGHATNNPDMLANTMLSFMVVCMFGGPKFLCKMLPVRKLDADFLFQQTNILLTNLKQAGANVKAVVCDGNRVNQLFFKKFDTVKPWRTKNDLFLIFDYVHLLKNIRNNWITEATQELEFCVNGERHTARWSDIKRLFYYESKEIVTMSRLTYEAVCPTPIERQKVATCLKVFCDETISALKSHPDFQSAQGTIIFLEIMVEFWKIVNVHSQFAAQRNRDCLQEVITSSCDTKLQKLNKFNAMVQNMCSSGGKRMKTLTKDTSTCLSHTCLGLVELSEHLLEQGSFKFVMLGQFSTDPLEKQFSKLRQGSGGTYFITVQQILEKVNISKAKLMLKLSNTPANDLRHLDTGHKCEKCLFVLNEEMCCIMDNLPDMQASLSEDTLMGLVYIGGYIIGKEKDDDCDADDSHFYYDKYGSFTNNLNRGGLHIPGDSICQWIIYSYIMFHKVVNNCCRKSLCRVMLCISEQYELSIRSSYPARLANIFFNNYCSLYTPKSTKEPRQKILKLSNNQ